MPVLVGDLLVKLALENQQYKDELEKTRQQTEKGTTSMADATAFLGKAWSAVAPIAVAGLTAIAGAMTYAIGEAAAAQEAQTQLNAVIASTGGVAGVSADEALGYASSLQEVTRFSDESIVATESMLLTFTSIGEDVFPQATETALDMATALGQDATQAAVMLGKALNNPVEGVTALQRVGVQLTDAQKDQVAAFMEVNDIASAQGVILKELAVEFGGSARAAGTTFAGQLDIARNSLSDVAETWGGALLPIVQDFAGEALPILMDSLDVMTQTQLPAFVELIGRTADGLLTAFDAGMLLVTWSDRIDLAYQQQTSTLVTTSQTYEEYVAGVLDAAVAAGTLHSQWVEMHGAAVAQGEVTAQMAATLGLYSKAQFEAMQRAKESEDAELKLAIARSSTAIATQEAALAVTTLDTNSTLLKDAITELATEGFDPASVAANLLKEGLNAITDSAVEAQRVTLLLAIAQKTAELASKDLTAAAREQASADLELMLNQQSELENLDRLNQLYDAGTITKYDWIAAMADQKVTEEELNTLMGVENVTLAENEEATFLAEQATRRQTDAQQALVDQTPATISSLDFLASAALNAAGDYEINFKVNVYGDPIPNINGGGGAGTSVDDTKNNGPYGTDLRVDPGAGAEGNNPSKPALSYAEMLQAVMGTYGVDQKRAASILAEMGYLPGSGGAAKARGGAEAGKGLDTVPNMPMPTGGGSGAGTGFGGFWGGSALAAGGDSRPPIQIYGDITVIADDPAAFLEQLYALQR